MKRARFDRNKIVRPDPNTAAGWHRYVCGYCGNSVAGAVVAEFKLVRASDSQVQFHAKWLQCPTCANPSVMDSHRNVRPGVKGGVAVEGLPEDVAEAYDEARACFGVGGFTGCELVCRKILMHVAVEKGAKEGEPFQAYIDYLADQRYVTPPMRPWVDRIRAHGNLATHRLAKPEKARAESTLMFTGELLRLVYEMDYMSKLYAPPEPAESGGEPEDAAE